MRRAGVPALATVMLVVTAALTSSCDRPPWAPPVRPDAATVTVPEVVPIYVADAEARLTQAGLRVRYAAVPPLLAVGTGTNGYAVTGQVPAAGSRVPAGSVVELTIGESVNAGGLGGDASGPVTVPGVVGLDVNAAVGAVVVASLLATVEPVDGPLDRLVVVSQQPAPGAVVAAHEDVVLRLR